MNTLEKSIAVWGLCTAALLGSARTVFSVNSDKACEVLAREEFAKAIYHGKGTGLFGTDCGSGQFWDPNGNCYSCPEGYTRTAYPVTDYRACSRVVKGYYVKAENRGSCCCKDENAFVDLIYGGTCWTCPEGYERNPTVPVTDPEACWRDAIKGPVVRD